jgi:hypothetical protein
MSALRSDGDGRDHEGQRRAVPSRRRARCAASSASTSFGAPFHRSTAARKRARAIDASAIPVEACHLGWQESLTLLTQLVEPEIKE